MQHPHILLMVGAWLSGLSLFVLAFHPFRDAPPSLIYLFCQVISANSFKPIEPVSSFDKFRLMRRLRKIGGILMTLHNVLMMEAPYDLLEKLFRKCCVRRVVSRRCCRPAPSMRSVLTRDSHAVTLCFEHLPNRPLLIVAG